MGRDLVLIWGYANALFALPAELYPHVLKPLDFQRFSDLSLLFLLFCFGVAHRMMCPPNLTMRYPKFKMWRNHLSATKRKRRHSGYTVGTWVQVMSVWGNGFQIAKIDGPRIFMSEGREDVDITGFEGNIVISLSIVGPSDRT